MPATFETGHAKNVANFENLISFCTDYGDNYNPSKESLTIPKLNELLAVAQKELTKTKTAKTAFDNGTNARRIAFGDLKPFSTKVVNALAVSGASDLVVQDAKTINRKIQGSKSEKSEVLTPTEGKEESKSISTSQQSYDSLIDHLAKLIETVKQESSYKPNEKELQISSLDSKLANLKSANTALVNTYTKWSNARISRDAVLYNVLGGLVPIALDVKKYVKSVFGATSPQFKQVNGLAFTNKKD